MDSPLLKYSAKEYFFKAALCHFCIDMLNAKVGGRERGVGGGKGDAGGGGGLAGAPNPSAAPSSSWPCRSTRKCSPPSRIHANANW